MTAIAAITGAPATMTSREMAELTEKRHDSVKRTIDSLSERGAIGAPQIVEYLDSLGRPAKEYQVGKRDSYVIVAQLSPEFTARLVDRWQELEANQGLALPKSLPEALRLAAQAMEDAERAQAEKLEAESRLRIESEKVGHLAEQVAVAQPKADALDRIALDSESSFTLRQSAAQLQMQEKAFLAWMHTSGLIYRSESGVWHAYAEPRKRLWLEHKLYPYIDSKDGETRHRTQVRVTARGMAKLAEMLEKEVVA